MVVIGGGYTGLWTAWHLKRLEPEARVVVLEAGVCGHGPSGRNGGFCNSMWFSLPNMRARWGDDAALAVARAARDAIDGVEAFCRGEGVDAWFRRGGYLQVSTAGAHDGAWEETVDACRELGVGSDGGDGVGDDGHQEVVQVLNEAEVAERCTSPAFRGGAWFPDAATVQPARLALGLRERLLAAGVEIYERSPVRRLNADGGLGGSMDPQKTPDRGKVGGVIASTDRGSVRAGAAVVAIGGAAKAPRAPLRDALTVTSSHIVLTEPVPELLEEIGWTGGECITDSRALIDYFRTTPDGRIAFGWGGGQIAMGARLRGRAELDSAVIAATAVRLREYFPQLATAGACGPGGQRRPARITHAWGGPIDVSPTHIPLVVPLKGSRSFAAAGYTGNGVGPSHMVARTLASLALDRSDASANLPFVDPSPQRVPPEPFHWLGGELIRRALTAKEQAELAGRHPHLVSRVVSRVPQLLGFHIGR
ncbi:MAG TPA: FAD-dependent oxidoreductase [Solirubrobacterales bacterium]|nr:FAD-dependent oxidoreductase [Solirubrobacterales bacterium]